MKTFIGLFVFASVLAVGYGLQCYVCHPSSSPGGKNCRRLEEAQAQTCTGNENFCMTIDLDGAVTRDCFPDTQGTKRDGCRERGATKECFCSKDLCNGSERNVGSMAIIAVAIPILVSWVWAK